ncbi:MAG TPA: alpha/beta hydrolase [Burkholderiales bacterium]|nr:alpha/beta hydrolase [Burkholderiales bacterium]
MSYVTTPDGVRLYFEEAGAGTPVVFVHEFSGDLRSWEAQIQHFSRRYRCIAFNARGYPPSDVPERVSSYSTRNAVDDIAAVMRHLKIGKAHVVGCSMGSQSTLHFGLTYPRMAISLTCIGAGSGSNYATRAEQKRAAMENARRYEEDGLEAILARLRKAPNRVRLKHKNPRAWDEFGKRFVEHSARGSANVQRGIQAVRPPISTLGAKLRALKVPTHMVVGDEDTGAIEPSLFVKRTCAVARLSVIPATGHLVNLEEPEIFNRLTEMFFADVENGTGSRPAPG